MARAGTSVQQQRLLITAHVWSPHDMFVDIGHVYRMQKWVPHEDVFMDIGLGCVSAVCCIGTFVNMPALIWILQCNSKCASECSFSFLLPTTSTRTRSSKNITIALPRNAARVP